MVDFPASPPSLEARDLARESKYWPGQLVYAALLRVGDPPLDGPDIRDHSVTDNVVGSSQLDIAFSTNVPPHQVVVAFIARGEQNSRHLVECFLDPKHTTWAVELEYPDEICLLDTGSVRDRWHVTVGVPREQERWSVLVSGVWSALPAAAPQAAQGDVYTASWLFGIRTK